MNHVSNVTSLQTLTETVRTEVREESRLPEARLLGLGSRLLITGFRISLRILVLFAVTVDTEEVLYLL